MFFFFFKQKTAYEMRISDWSSTCALPIYRLMPLRVSPEGEMVGLNQAEHGAGSAMLDLVNDMERHRSEGYFAQPVRVVIGSEVERSEERRVGKGGVSTCRYRWSSDH